MLLTLWKLHGPVFTLGAVVMVVTVTLEGPLPVYLASVAAILLGIAMRVTLVRRHQTPRRGEPAPEPLLLPAPFTGRWQALNSPATKVPSHVHSHAQTYAIDVLYEPEEGPKEPPFAWLWPVFRRPERYPSFGRPMVAPAAGTVIAAHDRRRDHLTRMSLPGIVYLLLEGLVRSQGAPRHLLGNHVIVDLGDGVYAVLAHLRRGSLTVRVGDRVAAGEVLALCGNSGNSSHPHLHFQLMDGPDILTARGLPFSWRYRDDDGVEHTGVPANTDTFTPVAALPHTAPSASGPER
ncbi:M23 family metallopeptidase [Streptomyces sp. SM12]|uniref:M23 family metallopeptidase n=1 Tax=Streptomyces sp. SM12 TaxID=1071602 RepID=UPI000CD4B906|nr:M23 family metallopeptidase [Streptomyces sp. SM12]